MYNLKTKPISTSKRRDDLTSEKWLAECFIRLKSAFPSLIKILKKNTDLLTLNQDIYRGIASIIRGALGDESGYDEISETEVAKQFSDFFGGNQNFTSGQFPAHFVMLWVNEMIAKLKTIPAGDFQTNSSNNNNVTIEMFFSMDDDLGQVFVPESISNCGF